MLASSVKHISSFSLKNIEQGITFLRQLLRKSGLWAFTWREWLEFWVRWFPGSCSRTVGDIWQVQGGKWVKHRQGEGHSLMSLGWISLGAPSLLGTKEHVVCGLDLNLGWLVLVDRPLNCGGGGRCCHCSISQSPVWGRLLFSPANEVHCHWAVRTRALSSCGCRQLVRQLGFGCT